MFYLAIFLGLITSYLYAAYSEGFCLKGGHNFLKRGPIPFYVTIIPSCILSVLSVFVVFAMNKDGHYSSITTYSCICFVFIAGMLIFEDVRWQLIAEPLYVILGLIGLNYSPIGSPTERISAALYTALIVWGLLLIQRLFGKRGMIAGADILMMVCATMWLTPMLLGEYFFLMLIVMVVSAFAEKKAEDGHQAMAPSIFLPVFGLLMARLLMPSIFY